MWRDGARLHMQGNEASRAARAGAHTQVSAEASGIGLIKFYFFKGEFAR